MTVIKKKIWFHNSPSDDRVLVYSFMNEYMSCVAKHAGKCGLESRNFARDIIRTYAGDILDTVCLKYKASSRECRALPRVNPVADPKFSSLLGPLSEVLTSRS